MEPRNPILATASPILQFMMLLAIIFVSLLITTLLGILIGIPFFGTGILDNLTSGIDYQDTTMIPLLKYMQIVNQLGLFIIPPLLFAFMMNINIPGYLKLDRKPINLSWLAGGLMVILALPFLHWLADINNAVQFPEFMSGLEAWMRESERKAEEMTELFINVDTYPAFLVNLLMIAILPAIGEELLFRGVVLRFLKDWTGKVHLAVILSAFIFASLHFQFYGFLPRLLLGILLGYMFVWSGSLWVPIIVHFINNAMAVLIIFIANRVGRTAELEEIGSTSNIYYIIGSAVIMILLTWIIYYAEKKRKYRSNDISLKQL
ncbi:MAG: CPBP family intramembrane glutamic endopeptidase [Bacteroidota bacterium]|nr:CPBP family intramembrane glutamic endopeptidase [Bacteroidota bacterium]